MRQMSPTELQRLIPLLALFLATSASYGQAVISPDQTTAASWKSSQLKRLDSELDNPAKNGLSRTELEAQKAWLSHWESGTMTTKPNNSTQPANVRTEPLLKSDLSTEIRQQVSWDSTDNDQEDFLTLNRALNDHPADIGLQQLHLHWMDLPIRRKLCLKRIEVSAGRLIKSLRAHKESDPKLQLAIEFTIYRRARALAYRELPDVTKHTPIEDPSALDKQLRSVYQELTTLAGKGHPEFILLEIRMLRRDKRFGTALCLVEKYGSVIKPQWYMKKRRDLLKELKWKIPYAEAAMVYADEFPEEVAKEAALTAEQNGT